MWDPASRRARVVETANLLAWALRRERQHERPVIRRPQPITHPELLEVAIPWQLRWTVTPSFSLKERLGRVPPLGSPYWLPLECHFTEPLRRRLRTARTRTQLSRPQRQCLTAALCDLFEEFEPGRSFAPNAADANAAVARDAVGATKRELFERVLGGCRCLEEDTANALRRWCETWRAPSGPARAELVEFRDDLLGLVWPQERPPFLTPEARAWNPTP